MACRFVVDLKILTKKIEQLYWMIGVSDLDCIHELLTLELGKDDRRDLSLSRRSQIHARGATRAITLASPYSLY